MFPLPFTWIFKDLSKFIFEPMCVKIFKNYLEKAEKGKSEYLDEIMRIYLRNTQYRKSSPASLSTNLIDTNESTTRQVFMEYIKRLQPSFDRFKQTVAYETLYKKVKEFEEISERVYN